MAVMDPMPRFTIREISLRCAVPTSTLRFWERKFEPLLSPLRSPGGQRRYTPAHIELIERIKKLQAEGLSLDEMRRALEPTWSEAPAAAVDGIERLADRVAGLVREEVYRYFSESPPKDLSGHRLANSGQRFPT